jgi:hypothetical protein
MNEIDKRNASRLSAVKTLERLGYTFHGGEEWRPPIGSSPVPLFTKLDALDEAISALRDHVDNFGATSADTYGLRERIRAVVKLSEQK